MFGVFKVDEDVQEKKKSPLTITEGRTEHCSPFSFVAGNYSLHRSCPLSSVFFCLFPSVLRGGSKLTGRGPAPRELAASWRGACFYQEVKYRPVRHPDRADSHSAKPEEFLPTIKGLFFHWRQACHRGGAAPAAGRTGRHSRYHLPLLCKIPAKSRALVESTHTFTPSHPFSLLPPLPTKVS